MVRIFTTPPASSLVMPSDAELRRLADIVYRLRPDLDLRRDRDFAGIDHEREFRHLFWATGVMGRLEAPDQGKAISYWASYARNLLQDRDIEVEAPGSIVLAAALVHGDIAWSRNALGLTWVEAARPAKDAWRRVLATGALRPASGEPGHAPYHQPGLVTVTHARDVQVGLIDSTVR